MTCVDGRMDDVFLGRAATKAGVLITCESHDCFASLNAYGSGAVEQILSCKG